MDNNWIGSERGKLNKTELKQWLNNARRFLLPLLVIYCGSVATAINLDGFNFSDFVPNAITQGAMALYVVNTIYDLSNKWLSENRF